MAFSVSMSDLTQPGHKLILNFSNMNNINLCENILRWQFSSSVWWNLCHIFFALISLSVKINSLWVKYKMTDIKMKSILIIQKIYEWMAKYKNGRSDAWSFLLNAVSPAENLIMLHKIFSNNSVNYNTPLPAINLQTKTLNKEMQRKLLRWHNVYCWNFTAGPILNLFN